MLRALSPHCLPGLQKPESWKIQKKGELLVSKRALSVASQEHLHQTSKQRR